MTSTVLSCEPNVEMAKFFTGGRGEVDGRAADGDHRRPLRPADPGHELGHARARPQAVSRPASTPRPAARRVRTVSHRVYS